MTLKKDPEVSRTPDSEVFPLEREAPLPPRSLYIIRGVWRYEYGHAISLPVVKEEGTGENDENNRFVNSRRRISVVFRNPLEGDSTASN
jgi:hypothetical protein